MIQHGSSARPVRAARPSGGAGR